MPLQGMTTFKALDDMDIEYILSFTASLSQTNII